MANRRFIDFPIASTVGDNDIILIWQSGANKQTTKATLLNGLPENIEDLLDVNISGLTNGQILRYDSVTGKWENTDQGNLDLNDLNDVSIVSPSNGQVLVYNSSTSKWENSSGGFVPYVGAVTTVDLGAQGLRAGYVRFDTTIAGVPDEQGLMYWDDARSTVALIMNGTLQHIGQDTFFYVKNSSGSSIAKGTGVRFAGTDGASGHLLIAPFLANGTYPSSYFMGVTAETIVNGSFGQVMHFGELNGINTSGYTAGALLYASTTVAGGFQTTAPVAPNNIVLVAAAINSKNNGEIIVRPQIGSNINNDEGVKITSAATGDLLQLQAGGLWENKTLAQVIGSAYVPSTRTITINGTTQDLSANRTFNVGTVTSVGLSSATSGVTIGSTPVTTSGTITLAIATASGSQNGLLSSTDWTTFNNKQNALTNPVTGTGTTNYLPKFTGSTTIGNSQIFDNGTNVGINTTTPNDFIDGESGMAILQSTNGRAVLSLVGTRTDANEVLGRISFTNSNSTNIGSKRVSYISGVRGSSNNSGYLEFGVANNALGNSQMVLSQLGNLLVGSSNQSSDNGARLQVSGTAQATKLVSASNAFAGTLDFGTGSFKGIMDYTASSGLWYLNNQSAGPSNTAYFQFQADSTPVLTILKSGNLGLGVTPSAWGSLFNNSLLQVKTTSILGFDNNLYLGVNYFATNLSDNYIQNGFASRYVQRIGQHQWETAPSGTAGNALTFTQAMTLTSGGNLLVGTTTDNGAKLQVSGSATFTGALSGTSATFTTDLTLTNSSFTLLKFINTTASKTWNMYAFSDGSFNLGVSGVGNFLALASTGAATFSSSVTAIQGIFSRSEGNTLQALQTSATNATTAIIRQTGAGGNGNNDIGLLVDIQAAADNDRIVNFRYFDGTNYNSRFVVQRNGNVGIGTSSPAGKLHIAATTGVASPGSIALAIRDSVNSVFGFDFNLEGVATGDLSLMRTESGVQNQVMTFKRSNGNVLIGTTTDNGAKLQVTTSTSGYLFSVNNSRNLSGDLNSLFLLGNNANNTSSYYLVCSMASGDKMYIYGNGNLVNVNGSYGTLSDIALKENIKDATPKLEDILKLKVRNFNLIGSEEKQIGFIAQELEEIFPKMVDINGKNQMKSIKTSVLLPILVKAIQELKQEIDTLKN